MEIIQLQSINEKEALQIRHLAVQLGYENDSALLFSRLQEIIKLNDHAIFVAKSDGKIIGWLHCLVCLRVESPVFIEVTGLVVDESTRGQQIGKKLIESSKTWSLHRGINQMKIRCNVIRKQTHQFYEALGFEAKKEQKVFEQSF